MNWIRAKMECIEIYDEIKTARDLLINAHQIKVKLKCIEQKSNAVRPGMKRVQMNLTQFVLHTCTGLNEIK